MIYTVTLNPSLDYVVRVGAFQAGRLNRTVGEALYPGGKGVNVSLMLHALGVGSVALGFTAGFTGAEIQRLLNEAGCRTEFIRVRGGLSRINVKIQSGQETEINARGPQIAPADLDRLFQRLDQLSDGDSLVLAGSIPANLPADLYEHALKKLEGREIRTVVDADGDLLRHVLPYRPFLIKPNHHELGALFGRTLESEADLTACARELQKQGARNVLVSRAGEGALLLAEDGSLFSGRPPAGEAVNSVGAGDSMVAGFLTGYFKYGSYRQAFRWGIAAGSATAFSPWLASGDQVRELVERVS